MRAVAASAAPTSAARRWDLRERVCMVVSPNRLRTRKSFDATIRLHAAHAIGPARRLGDSARQHAALRAGAAAARWRDVPRTWRRRPMEVATPALNVAA